ncbi:class I SAM-dependent methyltransferase [Hymenobacter sp. RP-2-7]|uniref:Class I SAM-dependent methyltransferase n=1 Tax=Hymenobacter polaris TaxID=2682546 RepID=A0A7Y0AFX8_9BACT|nr:class I SAM-dependent methyltransferase [Hymenobacter polaris]NML66626.1 class I SAM-dependent methyltransferase [Hymenobacter polaris]
MHYLLKAAVQNAVAWLPRPLGQPLYYQLQRRFGALRQVDYWRHLEKAAKIAGILRQQNLPLERCFLEVGTGWVLGTPLGLWLAGAAEVITVDLHSYLKEELVLGLLTYVGAHAAELPALFPWVPRAELARKAQVLAGCHSLAELWAAVPIRYAAPADATRLELPAASVDYHYSTNVLEHVPAATLAGLLAEARRVLRPGGYLVHLVDLSDHFGHDDPRRTAVHFLRHGPLAWRLLAGNRFMYQNRLRLPQYRALFAAAGLPIAWERAVTDAPSLALLQAPRPPVHPQFRRFSAEELASVYWEVLAVNP